MTTQQIERLYRQFRKQGESSERARHNARIYARWQSLEWSDVGDDGDVRIIVKPDDSYDWDDEQERERYGNDGAWGVIGEYRESPTSPWVHADSVWGFVGYRDVCSPFENPYVIDIMAKTLDQLDAAHGAVESHEEVLP